MKLKAGQVVAERYEIDDTIGSGGMSVVYRAHDTKLDRFVTLKVLKEDYLSDENLIGRFPEEARAAAALNNQNIVSIFDHGRDGDIQYIVLEYVDGASLKELIVKKAPFDNETILGVAIQVADGLSEAHRNNIIHLDIKPQNILVTTTSIVKVTDFGIARAAKSATLTAGAGSMGSVHYFSPEQARGGYIDHKSDIYSLGIVMYEMATGELPFDGDNEVAVALKHINDPLPDILMLNRHVSESVIRIIQKATEKSPTKRYQAVDDMAADLKRALTDASGAFVHIEPEDQSPTIIISGENREAIRRQKLRQSFLDGNVTGDDHGGYMPDEYEEYQEYEEYEEYTDDYYEEYEEVAPKKKSDHIPILLGVFFGLIVSVFIGIGAWNFIQRLSPERIAAPFVEGMTMDEARSVTTEYGLNLLVREEIYSLDVAEGYIIEQSMDPGTLMSPGDTLFVLLSLGEPSEHRMPHLTMSSYADARQQLDSLPITLVINVELDNDSTLPVDTVVEQQPSANTYLRDGDTITLWLSAESAGNTAMVAVPMLIGLTEVAAAFVLSENMLESGTLTRQESTTYPMGVIFAQDPGPGEHAAVNSAVNITVSSGPPLSPTPTPAANDPAENATTPAELVPDQDTTATEPDPTPPPDEPPLVEDTLVLYLWPVPEGTETVHVRIWRVVGNDPPLLFKNDSNVHVNQFPMEIAVQGRGEELFLIYSVEPDGSDHPRFRQTMDFRQ